MSKRKLKCISLSLVLCMLLGLLSGCGSSDTQSGDSTGTEAAETTAANESSYKELTVYTALPESEIPYYFNAFEKDTGIRVNYVRLSAGEMLARVTAEGDNVNAAVMFGGSSEVYITASEEGMLDAYQPKDIVNVPETYVDSEGVWVPFYVGALSFACNTDWFEKNNLELPATWDDLLKPEFKEQISMAHPSTSGTSYTILATIVQMMGEENAWEYLKELDANVRQYTKAGAAPPMEVALGEASIALTFAHDGLKPAEEGYPIEIVFPEDGTGYEIGAMAILKNGPEKEKENAKTFIDWALSSRGQECFIEAKANRLPINREAKVADGLKTLDEIKVIDYDAIWSSENRERLVEEFSSKIDNAEELKE
ncbi:MAG: ABC transporter substrate-binding protein [Lachnospiraceae bacterium]